MATMNISLPDEMKAWIEQQAKGVRYSNTSDYVRDLVRRDQERQEAIAEIQAEIDAARETGPAEPFDLDAFVARKLGAHGG
ncbi:type II toxin-antitoxin system ParD family antitoxin [Roseitranquillus sediminis]|uniref:type II toxin-antitoxin system ParD family antitoxin n=1 Tax=Roseitranquillus sediminis TaxID=2809051 RepID=UPI001D0C8F7C|nr:type II toxin-antitoxin system ParD family antitoxin [Roseitranquillus sediminis]MBM9593996.1 type II toxin-antitoxin system ParD family antitoxin [Roseitranquillus sediminis]